MVKIFVSYSRVDSDVMKKFAELLSYGCDVWFDTAGIVGGEDWWKRILSEIEQREHFVYLLSRDSVDSEYCQKELDKALELGKNIIPVRIRAKTELPEKIKHIQAIPADEEKVFADGISRVYGAILKHNKFERQPKLTEVHQQEDMKVLRELWSIISGELMKNFLLDIHLHFSVRLAVYGGTIGTYTDLRRKPEYIMYNNTLENVLREFDKYIEEVDSLVWKSYTLDEAHENLIPLSNIASDVKNKLYPTEERTFEKLRELRRNILTELPEFIFPIKG